MKTKKTESNSGITVSVEEFGTLAICSIRYCQGRQTYMPDLVRGIIKPHFEKMDDRDIKVMIDDCDYQESFNLYGSEIIDKPGWLLWRKLLVEEGQRRKD